VGGNPASYIDLDGLVKYRPVAGTNYGARIDNPTQPNQQRHAHIYDNKGNQITVVNQDGTGSHGSCPDKELPKDRKLRDFLRTNGFKIGGAARIGLLGAISGVAVAAQVGCEVGTEINNSYGVQIGDFIWDVMH
jgi:hypothetical protein